MSFGDAFEILNFANLGATFLIYNAFNTVASLTFLSLSTHYSMAMEPVGFGFLCLIGALGNIYDSHHNVDVQTMGKEKSIYDLNPFHCAIPCSIFYSSRGKPWIHIIGLPFSLFWY